MKQLILTLVLSLVLVSCENTNLFLLTDAATDAVTAVTLSDEDVQHLAQQAVAATDSTYQVAPAGNSYEARLHGLTAGLQNYDDRTFNFKVYLTHEVNAFALADGSIRVFSGLMELMSDDELLFVIGHEMGHVVQEHSRRKVVLAYSSQALRKALASQQNEVGQMAGSVLGGLVEQLTQAQFSQHEERQADRYGLAFLQTQGYEASSAVSALDKLAALSAQHTFLSSHPDPGQRAARLAAGAEVLDEESDSLLARLLGLIKTIVVFIYSLVRGLLEWVWSLW